MREKTDTSNKMCHFILSSTVYFWSEDSFYPIRLYKLGRQLVKQELHSIIASQWQVETSLCHSVGAKDPLILFLFEDKSASVRARQMANLWHFPFPFFL